jgi:histidine triad (HIT) family protein
MSSIFSKIISSEIPSFKIYEDDFVYVFLDIFPQTPGHTLIVPKCEIDHFSEVPEPYYSAIFQAAKKIAPAIKKATGCKRVCALFAGYEVAHCHYHLLATNSLEDVHWKTMPKADTEDLKKIQEAITSFL